MKWEKRIYMLLLLAVTVIGIVVALVFRAGLSPLDAADSAIGGYYINEDLEDANMIFGFSMHQTAEEYLQDAELAVIAIPTGNREAKTYGTLCELQVSRVLKENGADLAPGDIIYVYEAPTLVYTKQRLHWDTSHMAVEQHGPHMLMQAGKEYLLLLDFFVRPEGHIFTEKDRVTYLLQDRYFSQYPMAPVTYKILITQEEQKRIWTYEEVRQYDLFFRLTDYFAAGEVDPAEVFMIKKYLTFREELFALLQLDASS